MMVSSCVMKAACKNVPETENRKAAALLFTEQGVPAWPEPRRSCGYSPPGFFPAPPA